MLMTDNKRVKVHFLLQLIIKRVFRSKATNSLIHCMDPKDLD